MRSRRMVVLVQADDAFHARVLAARLGSDGILTELRGGVDGPYPTGPVLVLVAEDDLADARQLLLVDEVESALEGVPDEVDEAAAPAARERWVLATAVVVVVLFALVRALAY